MSDQPKIATPCPSCGNRTLFIGSGGHLTCSLIGCPEPSVAHAWNRRDGLLPALRIVRERCIQIIRDDMGVPVFAGAAATWIWRRLNDAALLELAGVGRDVPSPQPAKEAPSVPIAREAHGETTAGTAHGDATPASSFCSQCGQDLSAPACGPTHALRAAELAGVFQAPVVPAGSPGADLPASSSKGGDASGVNDGKTDLHDSISVNEAGADVNAPSAGGVPENTGPATASFLPYAEYAPPIKQAAEPAERMDYAEWEIRLRRHAQIEALLDAARDLREMADERTRQDDGPAAMQILMCVARLEARAR